MLVWPAFLLPVVLFVPASLAQNCVLPGICSADNDIDHIVDTVEECRQECLDATTCQWYSFQPITTNFTLCSLYETCGTLDTTCGADCMTSRIDCPTCTLTGTACVNGTNAGAGLPQVQVTTAEDCLAQCYVTPNCNWYSFLGPATCQLYETCGLGTLANFTSGQRECMASAATKIFLQDNTGCGLIPFPGGANNCSAPPRVPTQPESPHGMVVGQIHGNLTVCGGRYGSPLASTNLCWTYDRTNTTRQWNPTSVHLTEQRGYAAATYTPTGEWWVTGGMSATGAALATTEFYDTPTDGSPNYWHPWHPLPSARYSHCIVDLGKGTYFIAGGTRGSTVLQDVYSIDFSTGTSTPLDDMDYPETAHACAYYREASTGEEYVLVAGPTRVQKFTLPITTAGTWSEVTNAYQGNRVFTPSFVSNGQGELYLTNVTRVGTQLLRWSGTTFTSASSTADQGVKGQYSAVMAVQDVSLSGC